MTRPLTPPRVPHSPWRPASGYPKSLWRVCRHVEPVSGWGNLQTLCKSNGQARLFRSHVSAAKVAVQLNAKDI